MLAAFSCTIVGDWAQTPATFFLYLFVYDSKEIMF